MALLVILSLVPASLLACGDDDEPAETATPESTATPEPPATETPSPTATEPPTVEPTPIPLTPELPEGATELGEGMRRVELEGGMPADIDPLLEAREAGVDPPACAAFVFAFEWGADGPGAADLRIDGIRQGVVNELGSGPSGDAATGCLLLRLTAPDTAFVDISFLVGELE